MVHVINKIKSYKHYDYVFYKLDPLQQVLKQCQISNTDCLL